MTPIRPSLSFDDVSFPFKSARVAVFNTVSDRAHANRFGNLIKIDRRYYSSAENLPDYYSSEHSALVTIANATNSLSRLQVAILSLVLPGLGQLARAKYILASIAFVACVVSWLFHVGPILHIVAAVHAFVLPRQSDYTQLKSVKSWQSFGHPVLGPQLEKRIADVYERVMDSIDRDRLEKFLDVFVGSTQWQINPDSLTEPLINFGLDSLDTTDLIVGLEDALGTDNDDWDCFDTLEDIIKSFGRGNRCEQPK